VALPPECPNAKQRAYVGRGENDHAFGTPRSPTTGRRICKRLRQAAPNIDALQFVPGLRILEVKEIKTVPYVPLSHPFVERLIGTIRREYLDQTLFWTADDLDGETPSLPGLFESCFIKHTSL
jgi:hypothetical protein